MENGAWRGTGWVQAVRITVSTFEGDLPSPLLPGEIAGGWLRVGGATYDNVVQLPFDATQPFHLRFEVVGREVLDVDLVGDGIRFETMGEPRFIEDLPDDMLPTELGG
jgi:hypothetical protein